MTSRPSVGRQGPQRSLSSTNALQRPPPHRTLSQQFSSSSPTRRGNEGFVDLTFDESVLARHGPRVGTSRLRVEISKDSGPSEMVESPKPISDAAPTWRPSLPPRGRPQLHFDVPSVSNLSPHPAQDGGQNEVTIKPMPLPVRPGQHAPPSSEKSRAAPSNAAKKDARPKPYILEVPTAAPHYSPNGHTDFFPWTGNHPEDQFSEPVIRHGFFDKAQMTQNETGSAKPSIFPALKHKSGLQTLSALFTSVLAQRRAHGQITSASTFKPPPRVTVTDTKREMWLKDLANPTISLRRLSRSIPHGIRGKVLLDQSLSKNIPIERAVWLAKCVGANELRSFRRKGVSGTFAMGGEAKWIRDFTVCVEQFMESILATCGEKDFKTRISYAIRLATHFYAEYLLDREHYMDWLVTSLENSPQAKLPMWLLITQVYWKDLLKYRKYGRRLSAALLSQLARTLNHLDRDILAPLSDRLRVLLKGIVISNSESFVGPKVWAKHRDVIMSDLDLDDERFMSILAALDLRNSRLNASGTEKTLTARRRLLYVLDGTLIRPLTNETARQCWEIDEDKAMLSRTILEWSSSSYRPGNAKIYVAARIMRSWIKFGADVTSAVLDFLDSAVCNSGRRNSAFYHLVSELARSEHFSTPRYLEWLIARGGLYNAKDVASDGPCATRLLAELPTNNLSESIAELRATLLSRAGFLVEEEEDQTNDLMTFMNQNLPGMQATVDDKLESQSLDVNLASISSEASRTTKSELGLWLRQKVRLQMAQPTIPPFDDWDDSPMKGGTSAITSSDFNTVRQYLELIDDYSMLADVLKIVTSSNDAEVLASCVDTLDLHIEVFSAIGALRGLFDILVTRLRALSDEIDSIPRVLLVTLSDLASRLPEQRMVAQQLAQELARSDRKTAADACSPVSDHMALVQTSEADFTDEIEKVLASGNSMDQATLERLFQRIILRLEESWEKSQEQRSCGLLLTRLRTFDAQQFDALMTAWIKRLVPRQNRPTMLEVFGPLISFGCLALRDVIVSSGATETMENPQDSSTAHEALGLLVTSFCLPETMTIEERYRLRIKQAHMQKDHPVEVLNVVRLVFGEPIDLDERSSSLDRKILQSADFHELLQVLVLSDTHRFIDNLVMPLLQSSTPDAAVTINRCVDKFLLAGNENETITTEVLLNLADDLSLPFCQVKLAAMFRRDDTVMEGADDGQAEDLEAFDRAIESAVATGKTTWASIVPLLDASIAQRLRQRAEARFLALFPSPKATGGEDTMQNRVVHAENLLHIIDATAYSASATNTSVGATNLACDIVAVLNGLWLLLAKSQSRDIKDAIMSKWLPLLLSFTTIRIPAFEATKPGHESRAKAVLALAAIFLQLQALDIATDEIKNLIEQTFDLALYLVDPLPEDMRQQCIRNLRDAASSAQISYLFSFTPNPTEWLVLSQKERTLPPPGAGVAERATEKEKLVPFSLRRWEMLGEPTPNVGENDTSLSLTLFGARRG
ncbi:RNA polymeras-like protein II mediator complex component Srb8 [Hyaloscypha bicolor E]|uniref:Mediator of RNA polymerase II transcription subunit 12 n=1 Tax=Hyaloscypha bicolor E TaxID=1095630 RepID=A0A2J6SU63_9HELO|nr:RNA polymeras-like protein II mediator complex component Srb8 [Hyaloscypha bicolor E]PMD54318.1 RNA polymeras-like protein II mediator complex component Srb8 [Hyaloscypha bicolor E]